MTSVASRSVVLAGVVLVAAGAGSRASSPPSDVAVVGIAVDVSIEPDSATIRAAASIEIEALEETSETVEFFLNGGLLPTTPNASPGEGRRSAPAPWSRAIRVRLSRPLSPGERTRIEVGYEGILERSTSGLFRVGPHLTELSRYAVWYPWFDGQEEHPYSIDVTLPADQTVISGGVLVEETVDGDGRHARFEGITVARDLNLIASDSLEILESDSAILSTIDLHPDRMRSIAESVDWIEGFYAGRFGRPEPRERKIPVVVLPRRGGSYARPPLLVIGLWESSVLSTSPETEHRVFHRLAHEAAHLLWPFADPDGPDDWLNEGLAEYCAMQASLERFGRDRLDELIRDSRRRVLTEGRGRVMASTRRMEPGSDAVRYDRGALVFRMLARALEEDGGSLEEILPAYRRLESPTTSDLAELLRRSSERPLDRLLDAWVGSGDAPRLGLSVLRVEPAAAEFPGLVLEGEIHQDPVMLEGFPLTLRASKEDRVHDVTVTLGKETTPFRMTSPFFPASLMLDPDRVIPREDESFIRDLLDHVREDRVRTLAAEGRLAEERGELHKAIGIYRQAHELDPDDVLPLYRIGRAYAQLGDPDNALRHHLMAKAASGGHQELAAWNLVRIGQALESLDRFDEARRAYHEALGRTDFAGAHEEAERRLGVGRP